MISTTKEWDSFISSGQNHTTAETCVAVTRAEEEGPRGCVGRGDAVGGAGGSTSRTVISRTVGSIKCFPVDSLVISAAASNVRNRFKLSLKPRTGANAVVCYDGTTAATASSCEPLASEANAT